MEMGESPEQAQAYAIEALAAMARLGIRPSPANFQIWYWHASGRYPDLSRTLGLLESNGEPFTEVRNAQLHERFFGAGHEARQIGTIGRRIEQILGRLQDQLAEMTQGAARYGAALATFNRSLPQEDRLAEIRELVAAVVGESARMEDYARRLEGQLAAASETIVGLRHELASARYEASVDALTGIPNRKAFDAWLREGAADSRESGQALSLLLVDIDHFKRFNDNFGHPIGDRVLKLVARTLVQSIKGRDFAARYGGEEFAILLPQTGLAGAAALGDQLRRTVSANRIVIKSSGRDLGTITLSIGAAEYAPGEPLTRFLQRADGALYRAKREGRNRVVAAAADPATPETVEAPEFASPEDRPGYHHRNGRRRQAGRESAAAGTGTGTAAAAPALSPESRPDAARPRTPPPVAVDSP